MSRRPRPVTSIFQSQCSGLLQKKTQGKKGGERVTGDQAVTTTSASHWPAGRLIVVSNRVSLPGEGFSGGLASALQSTLAENGGAWFGWSGNIGESSGAQVTHITSGAAEYVTIDLSRSDYDDYYAGFANGTLWPILHYRMDLVDYQKKHLDGYLRVNALFADRLLELIEPGDTVWVHDYQLIPLAAMLRERGVDNRIGFSLHTPLPESSLLVNLPGHRALFDTLASYDLVGVHTPRDLRALEDYFLREAGAQTRLGGCLRMASGRKFRAGAFPISIDTMALAKLARRSALHTETLQLRASLGGTALIIGVDRLDYSKGLLQRFQAYAHLLDRAPDLHGKVTFLQIAPFSRCELGTYRTIRDELEHYAGHLNGKYATPEWAPLRYINKSFPHSILAGYYRAARVGLVTPLRDGMNLVAKEYVVCQNPDDPGVLVLSRFAGAAHELTGAVLVNPADTDEVARALEQAIRMPLAERRSRYREMMAVLVANDVTGWRTGFLASLRDETGGSPCVPPAASYIMDAPPLALTL